MHGRQFVIPTGEPAPFAGSERSIPSLSFRPEGRRFELYRSGGIPPRLQIWGLSLLTSGCRNQASNGQPRICRSPGSWSMVADIWSL